MTVAAPSPYVAIKCGYVETCFQLLDQSLRPEQCGHCRCDGQQECEPGEEGGDLLGLDLVREVMADLVVRGAKLIGSFRGE